MKKTKNNNKNRKWLYTNSHADGLAIEVLMTIVLFIAIYILGKLFL